MRQGYAKPRKVNFAKDCRVTNEGDGCAVYAIGKYDQQVTPAK